MPVSPSTRRLLVAGTIAAIGWACATPIIVLAPSDVEDPLREYKSSKQYETSMERIGGKSAVFGSEINELLASLFRGARFGYTIGVASLVVAAISLAWKSPASRTLER